jgi:hypothetical protein
MNAGLELPGGGLFPNKVEVDAYGLDRIGWPTYVEAPDGYVFNPALDKSKNGGVNVIEDVRNSWHKTVFLFRALWGWSGSPESWADAFHDDLKKLDMLSTMSDPNPAKRHGARQCALDADLEVDDAAWVLRALRRLLAVLPGRGITWSFQPHKGGIISDELVDFINTERWITIAPFKYRNNMQPCSERWVIEDLKSRGIRDDKILIWFDRYEEGFNGFLFGIT